MKGKGDGADAVALASAHGFTPDPWQEALIKQCLADDAYQIGFSVPRQNGKNGVVEVVEFYAALVRGDHIVHTSHQIATSLEHFYRLCHRWFENPQYKDVMRRATIRHGRGSEEIVCDNGGRISFHSRSSVRGRGFSCDWLILDEAQEMNDDMWASLSPSLSASPDARIIMLGTPPISSRTGQGVVFQRFRREAYEEGLKRGYVYAEWGIGDVDAPGFGDPRTWERVNPAWNYRIDRKVIEGDYRLMDRDAFAREHLGYWYKGLRNVAYRPKDWEVGLVPARPPHEAVERFAVGIAYAQNGERWAAAFGAVLKNGGQYAELIDLADTKKGTAQIIQVIAAFAAKKGFVGVLAYGRAGTLNLIGDAEAAGLFKGELIEICRHADKLAANGLFDALVTGGAFLHVEQDALRESVLSLDKYMANASGGGFGYISRGGGLIASEAAALALYWSKNRKPKPKRPKQKIW